LSFLGDGDGEGKVTMAKLELLDTTLREGEQCFGVFFPVGVKKQIAMLLDRIGVDFIEVGHPAAAPSIREAASEIASLKLEAELIGHARLVKSEIRLVKEVGLKWVGLFCGINGHARRKYGLSLRQIFRQAADAVLFAKESGLSVKFTCEDASRTDPDDLIAFYRHLISIGADRISYADTVGVASPAEVRRVCALLKREFLLGMMHFHFHDDFGHALENAEIAADHGAACIDASILGIGERAGIVPLEKALRLSADRWYAAHDAYQENREVVERAVSLVSSCMNPAHFPMRRLAHKSGIHINGVLKDAAAYEGAGLQSAGDRRILVLSKLIGKSGLREMLRRFGFHADEAMTASLLEHIKEAEFLELSDPEEIKEYFAAWEREHSLPLRS
jgi:2-isopropylmalate synthase